MKHTKGPWKLINYELEDKGKGGDWCGRIEGFNGEKVYAGASSFNAINKLTNAEFIVRACNSHYELLEALKTIVDLPDEMSCPTVKNYARQAISKVEGK